MTFSVLPDREKQQRTTLLLLCAVFLAALIVRLAFVHFFKSPPINDLLWNDAVGWNLSQGNGYTASLDAPRVPGIFRTPGYPAFLAAVYFVFGHSYDAAYYANALLDSFTALLMAIICLRYFSVTTSFLAAGLYAIYPYPAMFCPVLHQDILLTFAVACTILLLVRALNQRSFLNWIWLGIAIGIATLIKPNLLLFLLVPAITILFHFPPREALRRIAIVIGAMLVMVIPWVIRNYVVFHGFPPLAVGGTGTNLQYLATEIVAGEKVLSEQINRGERVTSISGFVDGEALINSEKRRAEAAVSVLFAHKYGYFKAVLRHIPLLWISRRAVWYGGIVAHLAFIISLLVLIPGIAGMILLRSYWRLLLPFYLTIFVITLSYAFYTVGARYTLPARPVMLMFAGVALLRLLA